MSDPTSETSTDAEPSQAQASPPARLGARRADSTARAPAAGRDRPGIWPALGQHRAPEPIETAWTEEQFDFHALDLEDVLSRNQRPKIDEYPSYLFIVLHFPVFDRQVGRLNAGELDIFVGRDFLVTIPNHAAAAGRDLFERCRQKQEPRDQLFSRGSGYLLYRIIDDSFDYCFPMLRKIGNKLDALEDEIFEGRPRTSSATSQTPSRRSSTSAR